MAELRRPRRVREVQRRADAIRIGDAMLSRGDRYSAVRAIAREYTLTRERDTLGRLRMLRVPTLRFTLADGWTDWERHDNVCDVLERVQ